MASLGEIEKIGIRLSQAIKVGRESVPEIVSKDKGDRRYWQAK
jgi:hypothetical protein